MNSFSIKHENFEGPLDLLLSLIEKRQFHVSDIALSKVTDDFIAYSRNFSEFPIAESAQFAFIASTLLVIKSRSLLPAFKLTAEEEANIEDLERRLLLLQRFRELSRYLSSREKEGIYFSEMSYRKVNPVFAPHKEISSSNLLEAIKNVLAMIPKIENIQKATIKKIVSLEETIIRLKKRMLEAFHMSFKDFSKGAEKANIIVSFLALLELVKQGIIGVVQEKEHGDILMDTEEIATPRY